MVILACRFLAFVLYIHCVIAKWQSRKKHYFNKGIDTVVENSYHLFMVNRSTLQRATQLSGNPHQPAQARPARVSSRQLLGEHGVLIIEHQGREYRLQLTQNCKLILTA